MPKTLTINLLLHLCFCIGLAAQPIVETTPPEFIAPCGPVYTYEVQLSNVDLVPLTNLQLQYQLPAGLNYLGGSINGPGFSEQDISDLNSPVFRISSLSPNVTIGVRFEVEADCTIGSGSETLQDTLTLDYAGGMLLIPGTSYNINRPVLQVTNSTNLNNITGINSPFERSFTIVNSGFREVTELIIEDIHGPSVEITGVVPGTLSGTNPTVIRLGAAAFSSIGDFDGLFEPGEQLLLTQTVQLTDCGGGGSSLRFGWGCDGNICEVFDTLSATVETTNSFPDLEWQITNQQHAQPCENGQLEITVRNIGSEIADGAGAAYNILPELGISPTLSLLDRDSCLELVNFDIAGVPLAATLMGFDGYGLLMNQLTSDPDGPGGLEDLDGDGAFDDLAVGESFSINLELILDRNCLESSCGVWDSRVLSMDLSYEDQCSSDPILAKLRGRSHDYLLNLSTFNDNIETLVFEDQDTLDLSFQFDGAVRGISQACSNDSIILYLVLPDALSTPANFSPLFNGNPVDFSVQGNEIQLFTFTYFGELELQLIATCPPPQNIDASLPCGGLSGNTHNLFQIEVWMDWFCDRTTCTDPIQLYCGQSNPILVLCPQPQNFNGGYISTMEIFRSTLGWTDESLGQKVSPNTPGIRRDIAMANDLVEIEVATYGVGSGVFDSSYLEVSFLDTTNTPWLEYYSDTLFFFDGETGQNLICVESSLDSIFNLGELHIEQYRLLELFEPGGCFEGFQFTEGDSLRFNIVYQVTENVPPKPSTVPKLSTQFYHVNNGTEFNCSTNRALFKVFNPIHRFTFVSNYSGLGCDTIRLNYGLLQGARFLGVEDFFPFEVRPIATYDSLIIRLPEWADYVPSSTLFSYNYRKDTDPSTLIRDTLIALNDPIIVNQGGERLLIFRPENFPIVDYITEETRANLRLQLLPFCVPAEMGLLNYEQQSLVSFYREEIRQKITLESERLLRFEAGELELDPKSPVFQGLTDTAIWAFEYCRGASGIIQLPFNLLYFDFPSDEIQLIELIEILPNDQVQSFPLQAFGNQYFAEIGNSEALNCRLFEVRALYNNCDKVNFNVSGYYYCDGYPSDPSQLDNNCNDQIPQMELILDPQEADIQINLVESPLSPIDLCEPLDFAFKILNGGIAEALNVAVAIELPEAGMEFRSGSAEMQMGNGSFMPLPDPIQQGGSQRLIWDLNLPILNGLNQFPLNEIILRFQLETNCSFRNGSTIAYDISWDDACAQPFTSNTLFTLPFEVSGGPMEPNLFEAALSPLQWNACQADQFLQVHLLNLGGAPSGVTSTSERIRVKLPDGMVYSSGSFNNLYNLPGGSSPASFVQDSFNVLEWIMPAGLPPGDSIGFEIAVNVIDQQLLECGQHQLTVETSEIVSVPCSSSPSNFCDIDFVTSQASFDVQLDKPDIALSLLDAFATSAPSNQEALELRLQLENNSVFDANGQLTFELYIDRDGDGLLDPSVDPLLTSFFYNADSLNSNTVDSFSTTLLISPVFGCDGLLLSFNVTGDQCACNTQALFIPPVPFEGAGSDQAVCAGDQLNVGQQALPGYSYEWAPANLVSDPQTAITTYLGDTLSLPPGAFQRTDTLYLTTRRAAGCSSIDTIVISNILMEAQTEILDSIRCFGGNNGRIGVTVQGGLTPLEYIWNTPDSTSIADSLGVGSYEVQVRDQSGCIQDFSIEMEEPPAIELSFTIDSIVCNSYEDGGLSIEVLGGTPSYTYNWSNGATTTVLDSLGAGTYRLTITDALDCRLTESIELTQPAALEVAFETEDASCFDRFDGSLLVVEPAAGDFVFGLGGGLFQSNPFIGQLSQGDYTLTVADSIDCLSEHPFRIGSPPERLVEAIADQTIIVGDTVQLGAMVHSSIGDSLVWTPAFQLSCTNCIDPLAFPIESTTYTISVTNTDGCTDEDEVRVFVEKDYQVFFPNSFTPNGDNQNDRYTAYGDDNIVLIQRLLIFDRWGEVVFEKRNLAPNDEGNGWDGTLDDQPLNEGVFIYMAEVLFLDGHVERFQGDITLIR
ncbi:MAG: gliding motility-associated C-terminal domain-containing protein [Bacteroidota bacterium]